MKGLLFSLAEWIISSIPGSAGRRIRYFYFKRRLRSIGRNVVIDVGVRIISPQFVSIGENSWIDNYVIIIAGSLDPSDTRKVCRKNNPFFEFDEGEVVIGSNCHVANFVVLQGHGGVSIKDNTTIASGSMIYSMSHYYRDPQNLDDKTEYKFSSMVPKDQQSLVLGAVVMEKNTGLGLNSVILPGSTIRENSWVGSNSLVNGEISPGSIAFGSPAQTVTVRRLKE